jgi:hypothetical protein
MKTFNDANEFVKELRNSRRIVFDNGSLRAEISIGNPKTIHRAYSIKYFEKIGGKWVAFSTFVSEFIQDVVFDFQYECKTLNIN